MQTALRFLLFSLLMSTLAFSAKAQTTYYTNTISALQNEYGITGGTWAWPANEMAAFSAAGGWGANFSYQNISGQPFTRFAQVQVAAAQEFPWGSGWKSNNLTALDAGDRLLVVIWVRAENPEGGLVNLFLEDNVTYTKELIFTMPVSNTWTQLMIPVELEDNYPVGDLSLGFHFGYQAQTILFGGVGVLNFNQLYPLAQLPSQIGNQFYGGHESDAPWRSAAADRIEQIRKANLSVVVTGPDNEPIPDAEVQARMLKHAYGFGSAVTGCRLAGNPCQDNEYQNKILDLDGQGHGFNEVVFENDLKWDSWEEQWFGPPANAANAAQWLLEQGIRVRGHTLVWPGCSYLPEDLCNNLSNPTYLKNRVDARLQTALTFPGLSDVVREWDVLNEITVNRDLEYAFEGETGYPTGRELYADIFKKVKEIDPGVGTWLNDYVTISQNNSSGVVYDRYKSFIAEIIANGGDIDGIGFQGHIGAFPTSIYKVYDILEDFHQTFGLRAKITEYDIDTYAGEQVAANYMRDFLTLVFSHPSTDAFLMWGFWDGAHWHGDAPIFRQDWSIKPSGEVFLDLVFNEWWTDDFANTAANGVATVRGFKGQYEITVEHNGQVVKDTVWLEEDLTHPIQLTITNSGEVDAVDDSIRIFPNPAKEELFIESKATGPVQVRLYDAQGQLKLYQTRTGRFELGALPSGVYLVVVEQDGKVYREKVLVW